MNRFLKICLAWLCVLPLAQSQNLAGTWVGKLDVGRAQLQIVFHLTQNGDQWSATMDSPDQMQYGLSANVVQVAGDSVEIRFDNFAALYKGRYQPDAQTLDGQWIQGKSFPLTLRPDRSGRFDPPKRPQTPKPPFAYTIQDANVPNPKADVRLAGTLTLPDTKGKHPAVVLITGSGAQDRNESILGHEPFWVLADFLTQRGYAVLRLDDRGVGQSSGDFSKATSLDFASDIQAAANWLRTHPNINAEKIGLIGHSEGGMIAPVVAASDKKIAFVVLLAAPGVPVEQLMWRQTADVLQSAGTPDSSAAKIVALNKAIYTQLKKDKKGKKSAREIWEKIRPEWEKISAEERKTGGLDETALMGQLLTVCTPWFRTFIAWEPAKYLRKLRCPVLALNGDRDIQVNSADNLAAIQDILTRAKHPDFRCQSLPGLNHLFQTCQTCTIEEYRSIEETLSPSMLGALEEWLVEHR